MKTKEQVDKRITELYSQIATSRAGVSDSQSELAELIKMKFDEEGNQIFEGTETRGLLQG